MAATVYDAFQVLAPVWELSERLEFHTGAGRILAGLKVDREGKVSVKGEDDLPYVQLGGFTLSESLVPGAPRTAEPERKNVPVGPTHTLILRIGASRQNGWVRRDPTQASAKLGAMEWVAKICDAIETAKDGSVDAGLGGTCLEPVEFRVTEMDVSPLAFHIELEVVLKPKRHCRGERHYTLPVPTP